MYKIDLLPDRYRQAIITERKRTDIIISLVFTLVILGMVCMITLAVGLIAQSQLDSVKSENAALQKTISELAVYRDMESEIITINSDIKKLAEEAPSFPSTITLISETVPASIGLTKLQLSYSSKTKSSLCTASGSAAYYDDVASWISALEQIEEVGQVYCSYTTNNSPNTLDRVQFELKIDILDKSAADEIIW